MSETTELVTVQIIEHIPAKVTFNYSQISAHLDSTLEKYKGLVFTEKTVGDCKKTIAELRKGQKALDEFRKSTKKELTASITAFEDQCKELFTRFDTVIFPLTEQHDQFEHDRKERKRQEIQTVIDGLIAEQGLLKKYSDQLVIPDEYFNKGKDMKAIKAELHAKAESLGIAQDKEQADERLIRMQVELANATHGVELVDGAYVGLLEHKSVDAVIESIKEDVATLKQRKEARTTLSSPSQPAATTLPGSTPASANPSTELFVDTYEITGTEAQLGELDEWLEAKGIQFKIL